MNKLQKPKKNYKFLFDFLGAMNNKDSGHSLRKWLAVGFYWIMWLLSLEYTTPENLVPVLAIHAGMITALIITYTAGNIQEKKLSLPEENSKNKLIKDEQN